VKNYCENVISCLLALGSNLPSQAGSAQETIGIAFELLARESLVFGRRSRLFRTPAFPKGAGPDFVNAALEVQTTLSADDLLARLHDIEAQLGRQRHQRWEARVIDIDLLSYGSAVLPDRDIYNRWRTLAVQDRAIQVPDRLIVPHPRLQDRGFVLVPLLDIAPDWVHPVSGLTVRQMHALLSPDDLAGISAI